MVVTLSNIKNEAWILNKNMVKTWENVKERRKHEKVYILLFKGWEIKFSPGFFC